MPANGGLYLIQRLKGYTPRTKSVEQGFSGQISQFLVKIHAFHITRKFRSAFFWVFTHRRIVVWHRRFGTSDRSHIEWSSCLTHYYSMLRNIPDERRYHLQWRQRPVIMSPKFSLSCSHVAPL